MKEIVFIVNEDKKNLLIALMEQNNIPYREAGYPNGKVKVIESFESKINIHTDLLRFAKSRGFTSIPGAIAGIGSAYKFKKLYNEHKEELRNKV